MSSCLLCIQSFSRMSLQHKRKRLDGASIAQARSMLERVVNQVLDVPLSTYLSKVLLTCVISVRSC